MLERSTVLLVACALGCGSKTGLLVCGIELDDYERASHEMPRPIAPWSTGTVTTTRPTFRWTLPRGATGVDLTLCRDRACASPALSIALPGTFGRAPRPLEPGAWFWRVTDRGPGGPGCRRSVVWEFFVRPRDTPADSSWGVAMDADRDGFDDVALAAGDASQAFRGGASGPTTAGAPILGGLGQLVSAGDVNGDGYGDALVLTTDPRAIALVPGSEAGLGAAPVATLTDEPFIGAFGAVGDLDRDGYADVAVLASERVLVFPGSASGLGPPQTLTSETSHFTGAFDADGDGYGDLALTFSRGPFPQLGELVFGGPDLGALSSEGVVAASSNAAGTSVANVGDVDGDGLPELVFTGQARGLATGPHDLYVFPGVVARGARVATAWSPSGLGPFAQVPTITGGDVDGDGLSDVVIAPAAGAGANASIAVYPGATSGPANRPLGLTAGPRAGDTWFGAAIAVGDVDGDGLADVLAAAWGADGLARAYGFTTAPSRATWLLAGPSGQPASLSLAR